MTKTQFYRADILDHFSKDKYIIVTILGGIFGMFVFIYLSQIRLNDVVIYKLTREIRYWWYFPISLAIYIILIIPIIAVTIRMIRSKFPEESIFSRFFLVVYGTWLFYINDILDIFSIYYSNGTYSIFGGTKSIFAVLGVILIINSLIIYLEEAIYLPKNKFSSRFLQDSIRFYQITGSLLVVCYIYNMIYSILTFEVISAPLLLISFIPLILIIIASLNSIIKNYGQARYHSMLTIAYLLANICFYMTLTAKMGWNLYKTTSHYIIQETGHHLPLPQERNIYGYRISFGHVLQFIVQPIIVNLSIFGLLNFIYCMRSHPNWLWKHHRRRID